MPAIPGQESSGERDFEVLVTGFGPFRNFGVNPAWLATKDLHKSYLSLQAVPGEVRKKKEEQGKQEESSPRIHIQSLQTATCYSHSLSIVPLIHGSDPSAPEAKAYLDPRGEQPSSDTKVGRQGNGSPFPEGYDVQIPGKGHFDLILHVGVGLKGSINVETVGHKRGYQVDDVRGEHAPIALDQSPLKGSESDAEKGEKRRLGADAKVNESSIRGFGKGYEDFAEDMVNSNNITELVEWLQGECQLKNVRQSLDAGRYLCDFIYYCSLCEAKRRGAGTKVQFVHIPPPGEPYSTEECRDTIEKIIWWLICREGHTIQR